MAGIGFSSTCPGATATAETPSGMCIQYLTDFTQQIKQEIHIITGAISIRPS